MITRLCGERAGPLQAADRVHWCHGSPGEPSIMGTFVDKDPLLVSPSFLPPPPAARASSKQRCGLWSHFLLTTEIRVKSFPVVSLLRSLPNVFLGAPVLSFSYSMHVFSSCLWFIFFNLIYSSLFIFHLIFKLHSIYSKRQYYAMKK